MINKLNFLFVNCSVDLGMNLSKTEEIDQKKVGNGDLGPPHFDVILISMQWVDSCF